MPEEVNQLILDKINESDESDEIKAFVKRVLNHELTQYTGQGGSYSDKYERLAKDVRGDEA